MYYRQRYRYVFYYYKSLAVLCLLFIGTFVLDYTSLPRRTSHEVAISMKAEVDQTDSRRSLNMTIRTDRHRISANEFLYEATDKGDTLHLELTPIFSVPRSVTVYDSYDERYESYSLSVPLQYFPMVVMPILLALNSIALLIVSRPRYLINLAKAQWIIIAFMLFLWALGYI